MRLPKINWKLGGLAYIAISVIFFFAFFYSAFNNHFRIDHFDAVPGNSNWPEHYVVYPSPALVFAWTWSIWRVLGLIIWLGLGLWMVLMANDVIGKKQGSFGGWVARNPNLSFLGILVISVTLFLSSYSNKVAGNNKTIITPDQYKVVKGDNGALKGLFQKGHLY